MSIEVLVASGEREDAAALADQLLEFGTAFGSSALRATGVHATALVALARGESETARMAARRGAEEGAELGAPYEVARCRVLGGRTLRLLGDETSVFAKLDVGSCTSAAAFAYEHDRA